MTNRSYVSWHPAAASYSSAASPRPGEVLGDVVNAGNPTAALTTPSRAATATVAHIRTLIGTPSSHALGRNIHIVVISSRAPSRAARVGQASSPTQGGPGTVEYWAMTGPSF